MSIKTQDKHMSIKAQDKNMIIKTQYKHKSIKTHDKNMPIKHKTKEDYQTLDHDRILNTKSSLWEMFKRHLRQTLII